MSSFVDRRQRITDRGYLYDPHLDALKALLKLQTAEASTKKAEKDANAALEIQVFQKIPQLSEQEVKTLVVEDKWIASVESQVDEEVERVTQALANRVRVLEERYAKTLPMLEEVVDDYSAKVEAHLKKMGLTW